MTAAAAAEEEALKRNTDCVYFLASPLTCKKGNECEYRHSQGARFNPRDCWYWLNDNCRNPKCSFRHPPLDGLLGIQMLTPGPTSSSLHSAVLTQTPETQPPANNMNKQTISCYYFQRGQCLKGEMCLFMHGPQAAGTDVAQSAVVSKSLVEQTYSNKKDARVIKEYSTQQINPIQQNVSEHDLKKPNVKLDQAKSEKSASSAEIAFSNAHTLNKKMPHYFFNNELWDLQQNDGQSGYSVSKPWIHEVHSSDEPSQNGRETYELLRESSPGFDVLVEDDVAVSDYFHDEDNFRRAATQDGRSMNPEDDYEYDFSDYEPMDKFERGRDRKGDYGQIGQVHDTYDREQSSPHQAFGVPSMIERRMLHREANSSEMDGSDLRHQLLKQRRLNCSRAVVSPNGLGEHYRSDDLYVDQRYCGRHSLRDHSKLPYGSPMSARLQGRITFPRKSSSEISSSLQPEEARHKRPKERLSSVTPINYQERHHQRVKRRSDEHLPIVVRNTKGKPSRNNDVESLNFAGPKSLAELKRAKNAETSTRSFHDTAPLELDDMKSARVESLKQSEDAPSFEDPKALSVILKRKRKAAGGEAAILASEIEKSKVNAEADNGAEEEEEEGHEPEEEEEEEEMIPEEGEERTCDGHFSAKDDLIETEDGVELDALEDEELENFGHGDGEFDYEGMEIKTEDENTYQDAEDELDDEDNYARKLSVMFS